MSIEEDVDQQVITQEVTISGNAINNEDGPLFSDTCGCSFEYIREFTMKIPT